MLKKREDMHGEHSLYSRTLFYPFTNNDHRINLYLLLYNEVIGYVIYMCIAVFA